MFIKLHKVDEGFGMEDVLVNVDNVEYIKRNSTGSSFLFMKSGGLVVVESIENIKKIIRDQSQEVD